MSNWLGASSVMISSIVKAFNYGIRAGKRAGKGARCFLHFLQATCSGTSVSGTSSLVPIHLFLGIAKVKVCWNVCVRLS